jgi:hypothetical protein
VPWSGPEPPDPADILDAKPVPGPLEEGSGSRGIGVGVGVGVGVGICRHRRRRRDLSVSVSVSVSGWRPGSGAAFLGGRFRHEWRE